ncbi:MAG: peroxide stress protein YaaA [Alphaproteobacteria bacterium]|nr:peroxide stress protein YaaA [Alphaproteobacteria bacterium]
MLLITSPSKTQDFSEVKLENLVLSKPEMIDQIREIISVMKNQNKSDLSKLMKISEKLAELNFVRYQEFVRDFTSKNSKPSIFAFKGDVYSGIEVDKYKKEDFEFAQKHLLILSGLYGLLRPLDCIQPYRLEMGTKINIKEHKDLYEFWGNKITDMINKKAEENDIILNLASNEYSKAIKLEILKCKMVDVVFKENRNGSYKVIGLFAKRARGKMINYIIRNKIQSQDEIKKFNIDGYKFNQDLSDQSHLVFVR